MEWCLSGRKSSIANWVCIYCTEGSNPSRSTFYSLVKSPFKQRKNKNIFSPGFYIINLQFDYYAFMSVDLQFCLSTLLQIQIEDLFANASAIRAIVRDRSDTKQSFVSTLMPHFTSPCPEGYKSSICSRCKAKLCISSICTKVLHLLVPMQISLHVLFCLFVHLCRRTNIIYTRTIRKFVPTYCPCPKRGQLVAQTRLWQ